MDELLAAFGDNSTMYEKILQTNLEDRRIVINYEIISSIMEDIILHILEWNKQDKEKKTEYRKPIYLYINSCGGDCFIGFTLIDIIQNSDTPVYGVVFGKAFSMAAYLIMACHQRYCFENSAILIHDGEVGASNSASKMKDTMKFFDIMDERTKQFVLDNTKITSELYDEIYGKEYYIYGNDRGKELGIIDYVIGEDVSLSDLL
jgi:ATP-dependent Clp protease protease subunit